MMQPIRSDEFLYHKKVDHVHERIADGADISGETIAWLCDLGICSPQSEKASHFRAMASGAFATLGWPDAPHEHYRIISDAVCIAYIIDDMYDGDVKLCRNICPLTELIASIPLYLEHGDLALLPDDHPLCCGIADLRSRLVATGATPTWLQQFANDFRGWLMGVAEEIRLKQSQTIPTVLDLLALRPQSGAAFVFCDFIHTAFGLMDLEPEPYVADDLRLLRNLVARIIIYPNDILSFRRESRNGHAMNFLTALCHHQKMCLQDAARALLAMHNRDTAQMHELSRRIRSKTSSPQVSHYVTCLEHFAHGPFEWGIHATRFSHELLIPCSDDSVADNSPGVEESPSRYEIDSNAIAMI